MDGNGAAVGNAADRNATDTAMWNAAVGNAGDVNTAAVMGNAGDGNSADAGGLSARCAVCELYFACLCHPGQQPA